MKGGIILDYEPTENGYRIIDKDNDLTVEVPSLQEVAEYIRDNIPDVM